MENFAVCGCGKHSVDISSRQCMVWSGSYWFVNCAFKEAKKELLRTLELNDRIVRTLSHFQCAFCDHPVGVNFRFYGNNIYCSTCLTEYLYELGGEGD
jgi:hypothetical protein